jgi:hypothetical protein
VIDAFSIDSFRRNVEVTKASGAAELTELGQSGWEAYYHDPSYVYLKRPVEGSK